MKGVRDTEVLLFLLDMVKLELDTWTCSYSHFVTRLGMKNYIEEG